MASLLSSQSNTQEEKGPVQCPEFSATRPDLFAALGDYIWIYGNQGAGGELSLRLPRGRDKDVSNITGEISWGEGGCDAWAVITSVTPAIDDRGNECWLMDVDEWVYENGTEDENETKPPVEGHMLHAAAEKDDDGNVYLIFTFASEDCWMIAKKSWQAGNRLAGRMTEGDMRRLKLKDPFYNCNTPTDGVAPQEQISKEVYEKKKKLGLEKMVGLGSVP